MGDNETAKDPPEGYDIIGYDQATEKVTVQLHASLIAHLQRHPEKMNLLLQQFARAITHGSSVSSVEVRPRPGTKSLT